MIAQEIVSTCSNPSVAFAAVSSIGGDFAGWFDRQAANRNLSSGLFAAQLVREFARCGRDWEGLRAATRGADMPILSGLRFILEREMTLRGGDSGDATRGRKDAGSAPTDQRSAPIFRRESCLSCA